MVSAPEAKIRLINSIRTNIMANTSIKDSKLAWEIARKWVGS
jgi:hypothetical protein